MGCPLFRNSEYDKFTIPQSLDFRSPKIQNTDLSQVHKVNMITISVIGQKGGTGKTTLARGLAVAAFRTGKVVAVIDLDPQASAANWKDRRSDDSPAVVSAQSSRLKQTLATAEEIGAEVVIIDTAGRSDDSALNAARNANLVLVPTRTNIVELEALVSRRRYPSARRKPAGFRGPQRHPPHGQPSGDRSAGACAEEFRPLTARRFSSVTGLRMPMPWRQAAHRKN